MTLVLEILFLAFAGVVLVSTALSLAHRRLARPFADIVSRAPGVWLTLGLLPLVTLAMLLDATGFTPFAALPKLYPLAVIGLAGSWLYRRSLNRLTGAVGVLTLAGFILPFLNLLELAQRPEMWPLVNPLAPDIYAIQPVVRLLIFLAGSLLLTGVVLQVRPDNTAELGWWSLGLTMVGAVVLPALAVLDFAVAPPSAQPASGTYAGLALALVLLAVAWLAVRGNASRAVLVLAVVGFSIEIGREHAATTAAVADRVALVQMHADAAFAKLKLEQEARYPSNTPLDPRAAERIYTEKCSTCHAFDRKVVGPAHHDVLPKYRGQPDKLVAFILNPTKVDPAFPPMVAPGLSQREAVAVADYLLKRLETGGEK
jgi:cytochrome c551/c552